MSDTDNATPAIVQDWLQRAVAADAAGNAADAEYAFLQALAHDPACSDARFGLGVTYFRAARYRDAADALRIAIRDGFADAVAQLLLGKARYQLGEFAASVAAFESAMTAGALQGDSLRNYARAKIYAGMIAGDVDAALQSYATIAGHTAEPLEAVIRDGFALMSAFGHRGIAMQLGAMLQAMRPDDVVQRHLNDAVAGRAIDSVPAAYVEAHFDAFADGFDAKLVGLLNYRVPQQLAAAVARHRRSFPRMLDLGCGTGLAGESLKPLGAELVGVDLSTRMLGHARQRGVYTALAHGEAVTYLAAHPGAFDLVFAADTLIYFGRLEALMAAVAGAITSGGIFAASVETTARDFALLPSGRFAHAPDYVTGLAAPSFDLIDHIPTEIRLEANAPARGALLLWRRR